MNFKYYVGLGNFRACIVIVSLYVPRWVYPLGRLKDTKKIVRLRFNDVYRRAVNRLT
jgi:hypothetical protein